MNILINVAFKIVEDNKVVSESERPFQLSGSVHLHSDIFEIAARLRDLLESNQIFLSQYFALEIDDYKRKENII